MKPLESTHILTRIVEAKRQRLRAHEDARARGHRQAHGRHAHPRRLPFATRCRTARPVRIIAEVKKASPSKGVFTKNFSVPGPGGCLHRSRRVRHFRCHGRRLLSGRSGLGRGDPKSSPLPVLRKDFVFDPFQIYETRARGERHSSDCRDASSRTNSEAFIALATEVGLDALVEVHDEAELGKRSKPEREIIGVNNRDLKTFEVDIETSLRLAKLIPDDRHLRRRKRNSRSEPISMRLLDAGADAFLIGEHF